MAPINYDVGDVSVDAVVVLFFCVLVWPWLLKRLVAFVPYRREKDGRERKSEGGREGRCFW